MVNTCRLDHRTDTNADIHEEYGSSFGSPVSRFTHGPASDDPLLAENAFGRFCDLAICDQVISRYSANPKLCRRRPS